MLKFSGNCILRIQSYKISGEQRAQFSNVCRNGFVGPELGAAYEPRLVENEEFACNYFQPKITSKKPFVMILPPPNITGSLHLGHALTTTIQDVIMRWKRMGGVETVWIPGMDHAGIATQVIVEKLMWKEKRQSRHDVGRERFQEKVWKWKEEKANVIESQLHRLGTSLDWSRQVFTMDPTQSHSVTKAFIALFDSGLIYRADHLVNWSCNLQSAISDIEVDHLEIDGPTQISVPGYSKSLEFGIMTQFAYKICDSDEEIVVATTRPETMLGDVAVAVNPCDDRYGRYVGRYVWHPFRRQAIPIICDDTVDPSFGTGAVKVTPAHDHVDFEVGKRHALSIVPVIDERGNLTSVCGELAGARRFDARDIIIARLESLQLLRGRHEHKMTIPICSRSKDVVEFLVRPQWFVKCSEMARKAAEAVSMGHLQLEPKHFERVWFNWLENIRDWCISRQLWWGHRIPVYLCEAVGQLEAPLWIAADGPEEARFKAATRMSTIADKIKIEQDDDVLDTWFSSALLPFTSFGWPQQDKGLDKYYPLDIMETGHDILFFWVARMVMLGSQLTGRLPFSKILLHGIICDARGRKMSKSLGNVVTPEDVISGTSLENLESASKESYKSGILSSHELALAIEGQKKMFPRGIPECGADALRFTLCSHNIKNHFINFDVQECYTNKLFCNKIWQATKYVNNVVRKITLELNQPINISQLGLMDRWILSRLTYMVQICKENIETYNFHVVTGAIKNFMYYEFCDVYLETTKRAFKVSDGSSAAGHCWTLTRSLDTVLKVLAPFMPRLAQHLHQRLELFPGMERTLQLPENLSCRDVGLEKQIENILDIVVSIRRMKKLFGVVGKYKPEVYLVGNTSLYNNFIAVIEDLASCYKVQSTLQIDKALIKSAVSDRIGTHTVIYLIVPSELRKAIELDWCKLEVKKTKLRKELDKMNRMVSGSNYKVKATAQAQELHAKKIATFEEKLSRLNYLQKLSKEQ